MQHDGEGQAVKAVRGVIAAAMMAIAVMHVTSAEAGERKLLRETTVAVGGMVCSSCSSAVERAVKKLDGVAEARADVKADRVTVRYDAGKVTPQQMVETIRKAGYEARLPQEVPPRR